MKKLLLAGIILLGSLSMFAQQPPKPPAPEERWKHDSQQITQAAGLSADKVQKMKPSFMNFYKEMDALMEKQKGERPKKEMVDPIAIKRNEAIRKILTEPDFNSFMKIERQIGPPPPNGQRPPPAQKQ
jgi:hypothetical protein